MSSFHSYHRSDRHTQRHSILMLSLIVTAAWGFAPAGRLPTPPAGAPHITPADVAVCHLCNAREAEAAAAVALSFSSMPLKSSEVCLYSHVVPAHRPQQSLYDILHSQLRRSRCLLLPLCRAKTRRSVSSQLHNSCCNRGASCFLLCFPSLTP